MFGPSLKSVPGCFVSIVPMLIGVPVALTPGFGPHDEVLVEPPPLELLAALEVPLALSAQGGRTSSPHPLLSSMKVMNAPRPIRGDG